MFLLDPKTLGLVSLLTSLLLPLVLLAVGTVVPKDQAMRAWMRGAVCYSLGFVGLAFRDTFPGFWTIVVTNGLVLVGYAELLHGLQYFFGRPVSRRWLWLVLVPVLPALAYFMEGPDSREIRLVIASTVLAGIFIAIAWEFILAARRARRNGQVGAQAERVVLLFLAAPFALASLVACFRAVFFTFALVAHQAPELSRWVEAVMVLNAIFISVVLAACLPLLVSQRIQRALHASELSLQQAQELAGLGMSMTNVRTLHIASNVMLRKLLGFPEDRDYTMAQWRAILHPDDQLRLDQRLRELASGSAQRAAYLCRITRPCDGALRWVSLISNVQHDPVTGGQVMMTTMHDVTALKQAELAALQAREEANLANSAKSAFLANMSHEIRTPMNGILGLTQLTLEGELPAEQRARIEKTHDSAQSLLRIINDILDLSKIEAGKLEVEAVPFDLDRPLAQLDNMFSQFASSKGIAFALAVDAAVPRGLVGDPLRLSQVLTNLVGNAVKFTEKGGVQVRVQRAEAAQGAADRPGDAVTLQFSVEDSGIGITPAQQAQLFQPFSQADGSTTRRFGGTGLGLSISRRLVELMGGQLTLHSVAQQGTTFTVTLGFGLSDAALEERQAAPRPPVASLKGLRVLLAEDNFINVMVATGLLEGKGLVVTAAENGRLALEQLRTHANGFDVVLMDVQMPEMDGLEATRQIRQDARFGKLPIIAMTADAMAEDRQRCLDAGMDDYLSKPIDSEVLFAALARWCPAAAKAAPEQADALPG